MCEGEVGFFGERASSNVIGIVLLVAMGSIFVVSIGTVTVDMTNRVAETNFTNSDQISDPSEESPGVGDDSDDTDDADDSDDDSSDEQDSHCPAETAPADPAAVLDEMDGEGTAASPFQITTVCELQAMSADLDAHYELTEDIDATGTAAWNEGKGFEPVGTSLVSPFTGSFDGQGLIISDLSINRSSASSVGLFGGVGGGGVVSDVTLEDANVTGNGIVGGLVGRNTGTVTDSSVTGTIGAVPQPAGIRVGGLVGGNSGTIERSHSAGIVSGDDLVGGLVGENNGGSITESYATGSVSGRQYSVGGLVGHNDHGRVETSYATGSVTGTEKVGGLVGYNQGHVVETYATGEVSGDEFVGGLVGLESSTTVTDAYWDTETTDQSSESSAGTGLSTAEMTGADATTNMIGFEFDDSWTVLDSGSAVSYPFLSNNAQTPEPGTASGGDEHCPEGTAPTDLAAVLDAMSGDGTETAPYQITSVCELQAMNASLDAHYELAEDIDAEETAQWNGGNGFEPIGAYSPSEDLLFGGTLDGNGSTISNLTIDRPTENQVGLFGAVDTDDAVSNVSLEQTTVTGNDHVGSLVGVMSDSEGIVTESSATGSVTGDDSVGGLVGLLMNSDGAVIESSATVTVTGDKFVGGLVGFSYQGVVNRSDATGTVTGSEYVGGLVGNHNQGSINGSHATGTVTGTGYGLVGGLVGNTYQTPVTESYATGTVTGDGNVGGLIGDHGFSTVEGSYATGTVTGNDSVGGLVGYGSSSTVAESYATGTVVGDHGVGGLVGSGLDTLVNRSYAMGTVTASEYVGGLVGTTTDGIVTESYATGNTTASGDGTVGGLVGNSYDSSVIESYATGAVTGTEGVGGLVGSNDDAAVTDSYATGNVTGDDYVGGLVGVDTDGSVSESYWDTETTGQDSSDGGTGLTTAEMTGTAAQSSMAGFEFTTTWTAEASYPHLSNNTQTPAPTP